MTNLEWGASYLLFLIVCIVAISINKRRIAARYIRSLLSSSRSARGMIKCQIERQPPDDPMRTNALEILQKSDAPLAVASAELLKWWPDRAAAYVLLDNEFKCSLEAARMLGVTVPRLQEYIVNSRTLVLNSQLSAYHRSNAWHKIEEAQKGLTVTIVLLKKASTWHDVRRAERSLDEIEQTTADAHSAPAPV